MDELLTKKDLARIFKLGERAASEFVTRHGIAPIDLGKGRGRGLRWHSASVTALLNTMNSEAQAASVKRVRIAHSVIGRSVTDLMADIAAAQRSQ